MRACVRACFNLRRGTFPGPTCWTRTILLLNLRVIIEDLRVRDEVGCKVSRTAPDAWKCAPKTIL